MAALRTRSYIHIYLYLQCITWARGSRLGVQSLIASCLLLNVTCEPLSVPVVKRACVSRFWGLFSPRHKCQMRRSGSLSLWRWTFAIVAGGRAVVWRGVGDHFPVCFCFALQFVVSVVADCDRKRLISLLHQICKKSFFPDTTASMTRCCVKLACQPLAVISKFQREDGIACSFID
jgi:hypothetical protein